MVRQCQVCKKLDYLDPEVSFHKLTKNRFDSWLETLGYDPEVKPYPYSKRICSAHFDKNDITITPRGRMLLNEGAVPKWNLGPNIEHRRRVLSQRRVLSEVFPADPETKNLWFSIVGFEEGARLPKHPEICSDHFDPSDIHTKANGFRYINPGAIPQLHRKSVFLEPSSDRLTKNRYHSWLQALGLDPEERQYSYFSRVCSVHFDKSDIIITPAGKMLLAHDAIPKLNLGPNIQFRKCVSSQRKSLSEFIPANPEKRNIWFALLGFEKGKLLPKRPYICCDHFLKDDFQYKNNGLKYLKSNATPQPVHTQVSQSRFPIDPARRNLWFSRVGFTEKRRLPKHPEICSDHFSPSDIIMKANGLRYIKYDANPEPMELSEPEQSAANSVPHELAQKELWCHNMGIQFENIRKSSCVCSDHFLPHELRKSLQGYKLIPKAVPSVSATGLCTLYSARVWAMKANREDLLEKLDNLHKNHRLCEDHFEQIMFTNHLRERLSANAIPTLFPSLEGNSRAIAGDHTYSRPLLLPAKIRVLDDKVLVPAIPQLKYEASSSDSGGENEDPLPSSVISSEQDLLGKGKKEVSSLASDSSSTDTASEIEEPLASSPLISSEQDPLRLGNTMQANAARPSSTNISSQSGALTGPTTKDHHAGVITTIRTSNRIITNVGPSAMGARSKFQGIQQGPSRPVLLQSPPRFCFVPVATPPSGQSTLGPGIQQKATSSLSTQLPTLVLIRPNRVNEPIQSSVSTQGNFYPLNQGIQTAMPQLQLIKQVQHIPLAQQGQSLQSSSVTSTQSTSATKHTTTAPLLGAEESILSVPSIKMETSMPWDSIGIKQEPEIDAIPFSSSAQIQLDPLQQETKMLVPVQEMEAESQRSPTRKKKADQTISAESITEEQLIEMLETESPLLTPEMLFSKTVYKPRTRYFGDIRFADLQTIEEKKAFIDTEKRVHKERTQIRSASRAYRRLKDKLAKTRSIVNMVAGVCDVSHIRQVLDEEESEEESDNEPVPTNNTPREESSNAPISNNDPEKYEENETQIDSYNLANQVQITFLPDSDAANEKSLKTELEKLAGHDISKSKKIKLLNNTIFMKNKMIDDLKSELDRLKNNVS